MQTCFFVFTDLSNRILRTVATDKLTPPSQWVKKIAKTSQLEISYEYRVLCDEFYYSDTCAQICRHRNDNFGHYVCDEMGSKVCLPGWQGEFCQEGIVYYFLKRYLVLTDRNIDILLGTHRLHRVV